jgi:hypothetical protein
MMVLFLVFPPGSAQAAIVSFNLGTIFSGTGTPTNSPPWLNATFADVSLDTVELTITAVGLTGGEKVGGIYFNLDPVLDPTQLVFSAPTKTGSFSDPTVSTGLDSYKADGDGKYDILIAFDTDNADAFYGGNVVKYTITLASLTANSFDFLSSPAGGAGPFKTAAHIQALGTCGDSAWITGGRTHDVPEPATMCILGLGAFGLLKNRRLN